MMNSVPARIDSRYRIAYWLWTSSAVALLLVIGGKFLIASIPLFVFLVTLFRLATTHGFRNAGQDPRARFVLFVVLPATAVILLVTLAFNALAMKPVVPLLLFLAYVVAGFYALHLLPKTESR